jgi:hypothetical protein
MSDGFSLQPPAHAPQPSNGRHERRGCTQRVRVFGDAARNSLKMPAITRDSTPDLWLLRCACNCNLIWRLRLFRFVQARRGSRAERHTKTVHAFAAGRRLVGNMRLVNFALALADVTTLSAFDPRSTLCFVAMDTPRMRNHCEANQATPRSRSPGSDSSLRRGIDLSAESFDSSRSLTPS